MGEWRAVVAASQTKALLCKLGACLVGRYAVDIKEKDAADAVVTDRYSASGGKAVVGSEPEGFFVIIDTLDAEAFDKFKTRAEPCDGRGTERAAFVSFGRGSSH